MAYTPQTNNPNTRVINPSVAYAPGSANGVAPTGSGAGQYPGQGGTSQPSPFYGNPTNPSTNPSGTVGNAGSPAPVNAGNGNGMLIPTGPGQSFSDYINGQRNNVSAGGGHPGPQYNIDTGSVDYIPGGTHPFTSPHYERLDPATGKPQMNSLGGGSQLYTALTNQAKAKIQGEGMSLEAIQLQKNIQEWNDLAGQIRKLGIDSKLVDKATQNLMAVLDDNPNNDSWLKNAAFKSQTQFVTDQMTRRLSAQGYAPGENSYGDNTIAYATGMMAQDWTKFWTDTNLNVVGMGNQMGQIGAKGQMDAQAYQVQTNPGGLFIAGGITEAMGSITPGAAWNRWLSNNKTKFDQFTIHP